MAPRILIFSIADYSFYVKYIVTCALTIFGYIISVLASMPYVSMVLVLSINWHFWPTSPPKSAYVIYELSQSVSSTTPAPFHQPSYSPTVTNILENLGVSGKGVSLYKLHFVIVVIDKMWTKHQYLFQISWIPTKQTCSFLTEIPLKSINIWQGMR